jgi:endonuclease G
MEPLPHADEAHRVPSGYWKIVAVPLNGAVNVAAFFFDQETPGEARFCDHLTTVHDLEQKSGLDFFWFLPDDVEERIEFGQRGATLARDRLGC